MYFLTFAIIMGIFSSFSGCDAGGPVAEPEIHLIPEGFIGHVKLEHAHPEAEKLNYEDESRVYVIPDSGTVQTATKANYGIRNPKMMKFYFVSPNTGERTLVPVLRDEKGLEDDELCIIGGYQVGGTYHYFVDQKVNAGNYKNPAVDGSR